MSVFEVAHLDDLLTRRMRVSVEVFDRVQKYASPEGALTFMSGWMGVDLSQYAEDEPDDVLRDQVVHEDVLGLTLQGQNSLRVEHRVRGRRVGERQQ